MSIAYSQLKKYAFACLALPTLFFALGYLKWYIGICVALLTVAAYLFSLRDDKKSGASELEGDSIIISKSAFFALVGIVVVWCYFGGLGNLYYQNGDWWARNAIFRDLISHEWPVIYDVKDAGLVYYIGFWLPPAAVGKAVLALSANIDLAFFVGNITLWFWSAACIIIALLAMAVFAKAMTAKKLMLLVAVFIFFSGLDIIGTLFKFFVWKVPISNHIEWWSQYQFSSVTTCLFWVFNQAVLSWLATACFLCEKKPRNYAYIVVMCASAAPLPCVGLGIYMLGTALVDLVKSVKDKSVGKFFGNVFTPQNIISAVVIFPIYLLYYSTNLAVNTGGGVATVEPPVDLWAALVLAGVTCIFAATAVVLLKMKKDAAQMIALTVFAAVVFAISIVNHNLRLNYIFTVLFEGIIYLIILWKDYKRSPILYLTLSVILICPLVRVGTAADFCMRASIPAVTVLCALSVKFLFDHGHCMRSKSCEGTESKKYKVLCILLVAIILIGCVTPMIEFGRGIYQVIANGEIALVNDDIYTLDQIFTGSQKNLDRNFIAKEYSEKLFFKYLAK